MKKMKKKSMTNKINKYVIHSLNIIISIFLIFGILNLDFSTLIEQKNDHLKVESEKIEIRDFSTPIVSNLFLILFEDYDSNKILENLETSEILLNSKMNIQRNISNYSTLASILSGTIPEIHKIIFEKDFSKISSSTIIETCNSRGIISLLIFPEKIIGIPKAFINCKISGKNSPLIFSKSTSKLIEKHRKSLINLSIMILPSLKGIPKTKKYYKALMDNIKYLSKGKKSIVFLTSFKSNIKNQLIIASFSDYIKNKIKFNNKKNISIYDINPSIASFMGMVPTTSLLGNFIKFSGINSKIIEGKYNTFKRYRVKTLEKLLKTLKVNENFIKNEKKNSNYEKVDYFLKNFDKKEKGLNFNDKAIYISLIFLILSIFISYKYFSNILFYLLCLIPVFFYSILAIQEPLLNQRNIYYLINSNFSSTIFYLLSNSIIFTVCLTILFFIIHNLTKYKKIGEIVNNVSSVVFVLSFYSFIIYFYSFLPLIGDKFIPSFELFKYSLILFFTTKGFLIVNIILSILSLIIIRIKKLN